MNKEAMGGIRLMELKITERLWRKGKKGWMEIRKNSNFLQGKLR